MPVLELRSQVFDKRRSVDFPELLGHCLRNSNGKSEGVYDESSTALQDRKFRQNKFQMQYQEPQSQREVYQSQTLPGKLSTSHQFS
jgi:hypothetical protein